MRERGKRMEGSGEEGERRERGRVREEESWEGEKKDVQKQLSERCRPVAFKASKSVDTE